MQVEVYTIKNCKHCKEAKAYLSERKIRFKEVDMSIGGIKEVQEKKKWFKEIGLTTFPVTIVHDKQNILQGFDKNEYDEVFGDI